MNAILGADEIPASALADVLVSDLPQFRGTAVLRLPFRDRHSPSLPRYHRMTHGTYCETVRPWFSRSNTVSTPLWVVEFEVRRNIVAYD